MPTYRLLIFAVSIFFISACHANNENEEEIKSLKIKIAKLADENIQLAINSEKVVAANSELASKMANDYSKRMFELEKQREAAAITQACKQPFNINVCPESVTAAGEIAIKNGVSGGSSLLFWLPYSLKFISIILILFLPTLIGFKIWTYRFKPIFVAVNDAKKFLAEADHRLLVLENSISTKQIELDKANAAIKRQEKLFDENAEVFEYHFNAMREEAQNNSQILAAQDAQMKSKQAALDALQAFKL